MRLLAPAGAGAAAAAGGRALTGSLVWLTRNWPEPASSPRASTAAEANAHLRMVLSLCGRVLQAHGLRPVGLLRSGDGEGLTAPTSKGAAPRPTRLRAHAGRPARTRPRTPRACGLRGAAVRGRSPHPKGAPSGHSRR